MHIEPDAVASGARCGHTPLSTALLDLERVIRLAAAVPGKREGRIGCTEPKAEVYNGPRQIDLLIDPVSV
ncbi:hypothetical protein BJF78_22720 [Pseudonocardia sp. CNS-139]|nr:hypothetical protein BJF78_22720 [Pseudonocardia sp. CNS-139]